MEDSPGNGTSIRPLLRMVKRYLIGIIKLIINPPGTVLYLYLLHYCRMELRVMLIVT
jgi:hypothetical protein